MNTAALPRPRPVALMVGEDRPETPLRHLARGLRDAGWEVGQIDTGRYGTQSKTLRARLAWRMTGPLLTRALAIDTMTRLRRERPELVLFIKTLPLAKAELAELRASGTRIAIWYPDVSFEHAGVPSDWINYLDLFVTTKSYHLDYVRQRRPDLPVAYVPHGYCDDVHYPLMSDPPLYDVAYVGNASPYKIAALDALARARPALRIIVSGHGWPGDRPWTQVPAAVAEEMARVLGSAKIGLGLHYGPHGSEGWADLVSARTFEIPACGVFMLHPNNAEVRELFEPDSEIGVFDTIEALPAAVDRWLAADAGRDAAAKRAFERARPAYSYRTRGTEIAAFLAEQGLGPKT